MVTPVVVSVPHAGCSVAGFEGPLARDLDVRCDADLYVDELYEAGVRGEFIRASLSRFVCDMNRDPNDVSAAAVPAHPAPTNTDGRGFIWMVTTTGAPTMARPLTLDEWQARRAIHAQYHAALGDALERARQNFGYAILIDGHSMPSRGRAGHTDQGAGRAAIVPGDRMGTSCGPKLSRLVIEYFRARGFSVASNDPYKGGYITSHHGRPGSGIHAIQIEMRRDLYMNEATYERDRAAMARLGETLAGLLDEAGKLDPR